jgi:hypothetical protein
VNVSALALLDDGPPLDVSCHVLNATGHAVAVSYRRVIGDSQDVIGDRRAMNLDYTALESPSLLMEAGRVLHLNQRELAERLGVSRRTIVRWTARVTAMSPTDMIALARLVFPHDVRLAEALALKSATTLERLGLVRPVPPPPPPLPPPVPSPPPPPLARLLDIVVCAVADALDLAPRAARPALLAGVRRARELGLKLDEMEQALSGEAKTLKPRGRGPAGMRPARRV